MNDTKKEPLCMIYYHMLIKQLTKPKLGSLFGSMLIAGIDNKVIHLIYPPFP